jgi:hypothetical protein
LLRYARNDVLMEHGANVDGRDMPGHDGRDGMAARYCYSALLTSLIRGACSSPRLR